MRSNIVASRDISATARQGLFKQLKAKGITDPKVLESLEKVPRELFTDEEFINLSYKDQALPIGYGQTISQPYIVAYMTEQLIANHNIENVLEIGTGSGYQTAVLANLISRVFTIERILELHRQAKNLLKEMGYNNINFRCADGARGWREFGQYDAIIVTAATPKVPQELLNQLVVGGRMIVPVGTVDDVQDMTLIIKKKNDFIIQSLGKVKFVPLIEGHK